MRARVTLLLLGVATAARAAHFVPDGRAAVGELIGGSGPAPAAVRAEVAQHGYYAGPALGAGACAKCHADVAAQWSASAHRFASFNNPYYASAVTAFRVEKGEKASRFCADCHDPLLVVDGAIDKKIDPGTVEAQSGIVCLVCHSITGLTDGRGNGRFEARVDPIPYGDPAGHHARLRPQVLETPRFCGACHKVGLTEEVTSAHWQRGQNDFDAWYDSAVSGRGAGAILRPRWAPAEGRGGSRSKRCQDCHMPLEKVTLGDQGAKNGMIRSHRFLAANAALPHLRGDAEQEAATAEFLRGAVTIDVASARANEIDVVMRNRRVGHRFPGGTVDSNEVWIEVQALDRAGNVIAESGALDAGGALDGAAHRVRAQPVDGDGMPIARRDVQHVRGVAWDATLSPADPQAVRYRVPAGTREVRARLLYRKFEKQYAKFACAGVADPVTRARCEAPPVIEMATARLPLGTDGTAPMPDEYDRLLERGLALADALAERVSEAIPLLERAAKLRPDRTEPLLGLGRVAAALGQTDELVAICDGIDARPGGPPIASLWIRANSLHKAYRDPAALATAERLAERLPDDRNALGLLARLRGLTGDARGALAAAERLLTVDAESEEGLYQRLLALRDLGLGDKSADVETAWLRHRRRVELDLDLRNRFGRNFPALADEAIPVHMHDLRSR